MNGRRNNQRREQLQQGISLKDTIRAAHSHLPAGLLAVSRKNVKNEHQQVGQFVVRLDRSIYRSLDNEVGGSRFEATEAAYRGKLFVYTVSLAFREFREPLDQYQIN